MSSLLPMSGKKCILLVLFGLLVFLPFIPFIRTSDSSVANNNMTKCIFCDIVAGKHPQTKFERETDEYIIFKDIHPASTHHYLAVTKKHVPDVRKLTNQDDSLLVHMQDGLKELYTSQGIDTNDALFGFHQPPFISVKHLHMHGIAPRSTMNFFNSLKFRQGSRWFKTVEEVRQTLQE